MKVKEQNNHDSERSRVNPFAFWPSFLIATGFILLGVSNQKMFGEFLTSSLDWISITFGWFYLLFSLFIIIFVFVIAFTKIGDIKFGGSEAKPEYTTWQWFTMALCGGIGTGILFWAMGEPIYHMATPPLAAGCEPFSRDAGIFAISQAILHWTLAQYAMYSLCGVAIGLMAYNRRKPLSVSSVFDPFLPGKHKQAIKTFLNGSCLFCIAGAVSCSMAAGLMQIGSGVDFIFGIPANKLTWFLIAFAIIGAYIVSSLSGIKKGMRRLSGFCTNVFLLMLAFVLAFGPTLFILNIGTEAIGNLMNNVFSHSLILSTMVEDSWPKSWIIQFMASFFVYAPLIGLFLCRLARGRTVRQFIFMNIFAPSIFCAVWISVWGGCAVFFQHSGLFDVWASVNANGMESTIFTLLKNIPMGGIISVIFIIAVFASFTTLADPMASTMATLSTKGLLVSEEAPALLKITWGCAFGMIAYLLVASNGADAVRGLFSIVGFPMAIMIMFFIFTIIKEGWRLSGIQGNCDFRSDEEVNAEITAQKVAMPLDGQQDGEHSS